MKLEDKIEADRAIKEAKATEVALDAAHLKQLRGFALMKAKGLDVSAIASKGGKAAHAAGTAHTFSKEEAKVAGKKGGATPKRKRAPKVEAPPDSGPYVGPV